MKLLLPFFFTVTLLFADIDSILYGRFISIKEAPYFISIPSPADESNPYWCGGSIISEYWVITAAHCVAENHKRIIVGGGIRGKRNSSSTHRIEKIFVHGSYDGNVLINDIALIKLKEPIQFDEYRQSIKIRQIPPRENETAVIVGLGDQGDAKGAATVLRQSEVTIINETYCGFENDTWGIQNVAFCAGNGTTDVCKGDSGGPVVIDGQLVGLVSYGPDCTYYVNHEKTPGVYTRVDAFYNWILKMTGIEHVD